MKNTRKKLEKNRTFFVELYTKKKTEINFIFVSGSLSISLIFLNDNKFKLDIKANLKLIL